MSENLSTIENPAAKQAVRKTRVGTVVSIKMAKTAIVETTTRVPHPKFGKIIKQTKKFYVHDADSTAQLGDVVEIEETRPISKLKRWRMVSVIKH